LECKVVGADEPVLLIHVALIAEAYEPLCREPALTANGVGWDNLRAFGSDPRQRGLGHFIDVRIGTGSTSARR
jgi:hypothetical protein